MEIATLIKDYLQVFISRPAITLALWLVFLLWFKNDLKLFLKNTRSMKIGSLELNQAQQDKESKNPYSKEDVDNYVAQTQQQLDYSNSLIKEYESKAEWDQKYIKFLVDRMIMFEMGYLNYFLVWNSKLSLLRFYNFWGSTQENYILHFDLRHYNQQDDIESAEKHAIFNALLNSELIYQEWWLYKASSKWIIFLNHIWLLTNK